MTRLPPADTIALFPQDVLGLLDIGVVLLGPDMRARFINKSYLEIWHVQRARLGPFPLFRDLLAQTRDCFPRDMDAPEIADHLDNQAAAVRAGAIPPAQIKLAGGRHVQFSCAVCPDGGRVLTYTDISEVVRREVQEAVDQIDADLRFGNELMENHASSLATLAEAADESARSVEAARLELEREIAERRELEARLRHMATTDGLTGALNRAAFLAGGQTELDRARDSGHALALLMIDVDHFKAVNDRYGHPGGDLALRHLVTTLRSEVRGSDLLGRLGGEEFSLVLPATSPEEAERVAERLVARVARTPVPFGDRLIHMTISVGLAIADKQEYSIEQITGRADTALYRAKGGGRNRMVVDRRAEVVF